MIVREQTYHELDSLEVTLLVHEFSSSEESRRKPKQQVLREGFRLVATTVAGSFVTCPAGGPIIFGIAEEKNGAANRVARSGKC
jgi:hypothetical protein